MSPARLLPNIIICGMPGTGKTSLAVKIAAQSSVKHMDLSKYAMEKGLLVVKETLVDRWDAGINYEIFDANKIADHLKDCLPEGGYILDNIDCAFIPVDLLDLVVVLRTDSALLYDRMKARGYPEPRRSDDGMECEISMNILHEAMEFFGEEIVLELPSNTTLEQDANVQQLLTWMEKWKIE